MTTYRRNGHWRRGKNGQMHWVSTHSVSRTSHGAWRTTPARSQRRAPSPAFPPAVRWRRIPNGPNAVCPVCGAPVWFFRNERGGCAYFDAVGVPWPKHPCMDVPGRHDGLAAWEAQLAYERAQKRAATRASMQATLVEARQGLMAAVRSVSNRSVEGQRTRSGATASDRLETDGAPRWNLSWWTALSMMLAWIGSIPLTALMYSDQGDTPPWVTHWLLGMPTVVSALGLAWFLVKVPPEEPTFRRVLTAVALAPLFLLTGMLVFLFTLGLGAVAFAWLLWWQERSLPSSGRGHNP